MCALMLGFVCEVPKYSGIPENNFASLVASWYRFLFDLCYRCLETVPVPEINIQKREIAIL